MTEQEISQIAAKVVSDSKFWIALIGIIGAVIGSILTIVGNLVIEWFKARNERNIAKARQDILKNMLSDPKFEWRNISTLAAVIGCDEESTKNHLIAINARGSEKNDGKWGLISRHPLKDITRNNR
ncbi:TPA: hypothetical protein KD885_004733 [Vibrio parahaemolyticus]|uniref:Uncharacterized protein n=1 Tax=Vibrio mytili TaxID=50718 RepID=A0A0C3HM97_9VIBR|nr:MULTISPECIES: hypothetical protein [Vibrio harveyi group]KIN09261.1 hypothetical protein SU60_20340 [Vibrio mytili]MBE4308538.1 hypothetical protein [Vibrio parahaemolyticus]MBS9925334.1 hypothetical protein [Vibrio alginolyticus]MQC32939.1 hypothetical protein [Vibrio parahaemolyticus]HBC3965039.1 hypothetical protein [Vibrio parahaemolyticus]